MTSNEFIISMPDQSPNDESAKGFVQLLADVFTDTQKRELLRIDPELLIGQYSLSQAEKDSILAMPCTEIEKQSEFLIAKRWRHVQKLIPETLSKLPEDPRELFHFFATQFWPSGHRRHLLDAHNFLRFLETNLNTKPNRKERLSIARTLKQK